MKSYHVYIVLVLVLLGVTYTYRQHVIRQRQQTSPPRVALPDLAMQGVDVTAFDTQGEGAVKKCRIRGQRVRLESKKLGVLRFSPMKVLAIKDVVMTFYDDDLPVSTIIADHAAIEIPWKGAAVKNGPLEEVFNRQIDFRGNVRVTTPEKKSFQCGSIQLSANQEQLLGDDNCVVRMDDQFLSAGSMQADIALSQVRW